MILEIRLRNFFSIKDEVVLDMQPASLRSEKARLLNGNIIEDEASYKALKSIAIYGANASGKSNIIKAIRFCCTMVFNSHTHNEDVSFNFKPFKFDGYDKKPSSFFIRFLQEGREYEYSFTLTTEAILKESLHYQSPGKRRTRIFERNESTGKTKADKYSFSRELKKPLDVAESTSVKTLFISRASQMDREIGKQIFRYFHEHFILRYLGYNPELLKHTISNEKQNILNALRVADSDIIDIELKTERKLAKGYNVNVTGVSEPLVTTSEQEYEHFRIITYHKQAPNIPFDFETEESDGTRKLFFVLLNILDIIKHNKVLLIDEIESSLHSGLVEFIIDLFHQSAGSQIIFTTHDTNLLNLERVRRDQVYFVNKKPEDGSSDLYSLIEFKDFRENMDPEKAYLLGRFDAIPYTGDPATVITKDR